MNKQKMEFRGATSQAGFSALELVIVLSVLTLLTIQFVPLREEYSKSVAEQYTLQGLFELSNAAKAFFVNEGNGSWPANLNALLVAKLLPGYEAEGSRRFNNGFGKPFSVTPEGDSLQISTEVGDTVSAQTIVQEWGPLASFDAATARVTVVVLRPGYEVSHYALLPRDGSRPMTGDLSLGNQNLVDADLLFANQINALDVRARDQVIADVVETRLISADEFEYLDE